MDADEDGDVAEAPQPSLQRTARLRKNKDDAYAACAANTARDFGYARSAA